MTYMPKKLGDFDVAEDGTLSVGGLSKFNVLDKQGNLTGKAISFKLTVEEFEAPFQQPDYFGTSTAGEYGRKPSDNH